MQLRNNSNWGGALAEVSSWVLNYCECACMPLWCAGRWLKGAQEIVLMLLTLGVGLLAKSFALNSEPRCVNLWSPLIARKGTETLHQAAQNRSEQQCCAGGLLYRAGCWCDRHHVEVSPSGPNGPMSMIVWTVWTVAVSAWCSLPLWGSATCDLVCECDTWYLVTICDNLWQSVTISCQCCANFIQFPISDATFCVPRGVCQRNLPQSPWSKSWKSSCRQVTATERSELDWSRIFSPNIEKWWKCHNFFCNSTATECTRFQGISCDSIFTRGYSWVLSALSQVDTISCTCRMTSASSAIWLLLSWTSQIQKARSVSATTRQLRAQPMSRGEQQAQVLL
jgi:hypothetical protein